METMKFRHVLIYMRPGLWSLFAMLIGMSSLSAHDVLTPTAVVSGTVYHAETNKPLSGATVLIKGTAQGVITNTDGVFSIDVEPNAVLVISFYGFVKQEVPVQGRTELTVLMVPDNNSLEEVVVTGYSKESKQLVSGSISQLDVKEAQEIPVQNAGLALQGRVPGVTVVGGGQPGNTPLIRVRGFSTVNSNGPLYVIDGAQTVNPAVLNQINPQDIESMNVLKDASAAIYGARASNGVIVVTTKSGGVSFRPEVRFRTSIGIQQVGKTQELLKAQELADVIWESFANEGTPPSHPQYGNGASPVLPDYIRGSASQPYDAETNRLTRSAETDWLNEIFQTAPIQDYHLSLNGGTMNNRYYVGVGYQNQEGIQLHTGFERFTGRINSSFNLSDHIRIGEHLGVAYTDQLAQNQVFQAYKSPPIIPVYDEGGNFGGNGPSTAAGLSNSDNPVAELFRGQDNFDQRLRVIGDVYAEADFLNGFTFRTSIGLNFLDRIQHDITRLNPEKSEVRQTNSLAETNQSFSSWVWSNTLQWSKTINEHQINVLGGVEAVKEQDRLSQVVVRDFLLETSDFFQLGAGTGTPVIQANRYNVSALFSYFGNLKYTYGERYLFSFSLRRDQTSRFSEGNNTGIFPSGSIGWIISNESFMDAISAVDLLKVRASYGILGNQELPVPNPNVDIFATNQETGFYPVNGTGIFTGATFAALGNPNLRWETSRQLNVGIDLNLFNRRLDVSFDYFNYDTEDMIVARPLPSTSIDAQAAFVNAGRVNNRGFDVYIAYGNESTNSDFTYTIGLNLSSYQNEMVEVDEQNPDNAILGSNFRSGFVTRTFRGFPISYYYGREVVGIFQSADQVAAAPSQGFATPEDGVGRFQYADINDDGVINDEDRTYLGDPHPDFTYGANISLAYKNLYLTAFLQGVQGNEIYHVAKIETDFPTFLNGNRSVRVLDSWSASNTDAALPALSTSIQNNETQANSYFVEDGSYMRLRNLQIGYNFQFTSQVIREASVYVQGLNLFTLTNYEGNDPELGTGNAEDEVNAPVSDDLTIGVDQGRFPIAKSYLIGLTLTF